MIMIFVNTYYKFIEKSDPPSNPHRYIKLSLIWEFEENPRKVENEGNRTTIKKREGENSMYVMYEGTEVEATRTCTRFNILKHNCTSS